MNGVKGVLFLRNFDGKMESVTLNSGKEVKYDGQIENGEPNGIGTISYQDLTNYVGEWKDGEYHGQGRLLYHDGEKYEGEHTSGEFHGHGIYTWTKGQEYDGEFKDVDKWNGREYDNSGINRSKYVNGVKQL